MTMRPEVSVITVTYNQAGTIARTLDSILAQECDFDYEIVIGEDCSTDDTLDICRRYAAAHPDKIRLLHNTVNKGVIDNYFDCIMECRGKYIADCPGDDYWIDRHKLQKQRDILAADPDVTLVHTAWNRLDHTTGNVTPSDADNTNARYHNPIADGRSLLIPLLCHTHPPVIHLATAMYRADTIRNALMAEPHLFRDKSYPCEDLQIMAALAASGKIGYLPDVTLNYSVGHRSLSNPLGFKKQLDYQLGIFKLTLKLADRYAIDRSLLRPFIDERLRYMATLSFNSLDRPLMDAVIALMKEHEVTSTVKTSLMKLLSRNVILWKTSVKLNGLTHRHEQ